MGILFHYNLWKLAWWTYVGLYLDQGSMKTSCMHCDLLVLALNLGLSEIVLRKDVLLVLVACLVLVFEA